MTDSEESSSGAPRVKENGLSPRPRPLRQPLGLAIVGCGQIVTHHIAGMVRLVPSSSPDDGKTNAPASWFQVRALVDPNPDRLRILQKYLQEELGGPIVSSSSSLQTFQSLDDLLDPEHRAWLNEAIDVILIAVPHDLHESMALQALQATTQQRIVLEKPLAITVEACQRLIQASSRQTSMAGRLLVAEQSPYWEEVVCARQLIASGAIGDTLVTAAAYYYESMRDNVTSGSVDADGCGLGWRGQLARAGGGIALDGGLHWIRPLRELCGGRIQRVVGVVRHGLAPALRMEGESVGHALFELEDTTVLQSPPLEAGPLVATYSCNMLATAPMAHDSCPYFRITGNAGEIIIHGDGLLRHRPGAGGVRLYNDQYPDGREQFPSDRVGGFFWGFTGLWRELARIVHENDAAAAHETVVRAADDVGVVLALYKSSQSRQWEEVL